MSAKPTPARLVPPGRVIKREIEARGWTQRDLAEIMGRPPSKISPIIKGTKQITPETAIELAEALGTSPDVWLNLESNYRLRLAQRSKRADAVTRRGEIYTLLPISELMKRDWIPIEKDIDALEAAVCQLMGVPNLREIPRLAANYRGSRGKQPNGAALAAWVRRIKSLAEEQKIAGFSHRRFETECIEKVLAQSSAIEGVARVQAILADYGVHMVILEHLPRTYLDGAALSLRRKPVVGLTLRHDRVDSFWFTLMHELAHIQRRHVGTYLDDLDAKKADSEEQDANRAAGEWLIPARAFRQFVSVTHPYYSRAKIMGFASQIGRHPGIVLGRLQREGKVTYGHLRTLLERVSPNLEDVIKS